MKDSAGYYRILSYGYPNLAVIEAMDGISYKWKIKHDIMAECSVNQKLIDSINTVNKATYAAIEQEYGKDWRIRYDQDIRDFPLTSAMVMDILITNSMFRKELEKYCIKIDNVDKMVRMLKGNRYEVIIYKEELKANNKRCFTVHVDTGSRTVNLIK
ncbi:MULTISPECIES: hypothetical protein [Chryseobacterium]|uniref:Uncharacterized protein n=1 Tax=Chryseobacterium camelliae TaxID=1265445 RepID=A0ABU0TH63_9FLAO|nr:MULTISPECIES: hypothetical protein [Chryseobacterium]MDT3405807.1 hypothetical protein [Pseudacidovorax intermedius]MDQ1096387.1 hypothetical protein [Chryseobacterium camelliae]MDQ1100327.1 hypothetical protein [Chryseobacterium sp. SORGH_AS_1048]MDR6087669.1 hypothetical protein [Chryseobacterium sp. SORGH_AS_0909]MDR6132044.1 hypothetical protein [Chryseobacterium sp. SORGH_AS_1175]